MNSARPALRLLAGTLALAGLALAGAPRDARACGHLIAEERAKLPFVHVEPELRAPGPKAAPLALLAGEQIPSLVTAEDALAKGRTAVAAHLLAQMYPNLAAGTPRQGPSVARALETLAVAVVRSQGDVAAAGLEAKSREQRLDWAAATLERVAAVREGDVRAKAHLGEALDAAGDHGRAKGLLEELAGADLLPDAQGFAVLRRLRAAGGEAGAAADAESRCRAMSKGASYCGPAAASAG